MLREHRRQQRIVIAMGAHGVASRVFFPLLGSLITYGYLHQAVAPGQLSLADLTAELRRYSPEYAGDRRRARQCPPESFETPPKAAAPQDERWGDLS